MKKLIILLFAAMILTSCGKSAHDGIFYKGTITKANGKTKQKAFIFGRDQCVRKSKRMARRRSAARSPHRHPGYGITSMGGAKQRR